MKRLCWTTPASMCLRGGVSLHCTQKALVQGSHHAGTFLGDKVCSDTVAILSAIKESKTTSTRSILLPYRNLIVHGKGKEGLDDSMPFHQSD